jgi:hypothetical protein
MLCHTARISALFILIFSASIPARVVFAQVNDPPNLQLPAPLEAIEDVPISVAGIVVSDPENDDLIVVVASPDGQLLPDFIVGTVSEVSASLASLLFTPFEDFSGPTTIDISVDDGMNLVEDQLSVNVTAVPPQISLPAPVDSPEDTPLAPIGFELTDADGLITVFVGSPDGMIFPTDYLFGEAVDVAQQFSQLSFLPNPDFFGPTVIDIQVLDGFHLPVETQYAFNVTEVSPQINTPERFEGVPDQEIDLQGLSLSNADGFVTFNLGVDIGSVQPGNISGSVDFVNQALAQATYQPPAGFEGDAILMLLAFDGPHQTESEIPISVAGATATTSAVPALSPMGRAILISAVILLAAARNKRIAPTRDDRKS